jgi:hypothetical protein
MWRRAFDAVERPVGEKLENLVQTEAFADTAARVTKWEAQSRRQFERLTRDVLHLFNLPSATDVKRVEQRLAAVNRQLRELSKQLEQPNEES